MKGQKVVRLWWLNIALWKELSEKGWRKIEVGALVPYTKANPLTVSGARRGNQFTFVVLQR